MHNKYPEILPKETLERFRVPGDFVDFLQREDVKMQLAQAGNRRAGAGKG